MDISVFQQRVRDLSESRGLYLRDVALGTHMAIPTLSRYLNGYRVPEMEYVCKLADFFNVSTDYLIGRSDSIVSSDTSANKELLELYTKATPDDRNVIDLILSKYRSKS